MLALAQQQKLPQDQQTAIQGLISFLQARAQAQ
jgi:hypothetical protein